MTRITLTQKKSDITGLKSGLLTAIRPVSRHPKYGISWLCECECGGTKIVLANCLTQKTVRSCGCLLHNNESSVTHGLCRRHDKHPYYTIWSKMHDRCRNPNNLKWHRYGGRGIKVCERWKDFALFVKDMGERPDDTTLDRRDNDGDYTPENCRWATTQEQAENQEKTVWITYNGETKTLIGWEKVTGIKRTTLLYRLRAGWTPEQLLKTAVNTNYTFRNKSQTVVEWANELGINVATLRQRLTKWSVDKAFTMPIRKWPTKSNTRPAGSW